MTAVSVRQSEDNACCFRRVRGGGVRLIWELISKCNLDCLHCFVDHAHYGIGTEEALAVIGEFPALPVVKVMFTGGEPFLRKDLLELAEACVKQGAIVDITTNLSFIKPEHVDRLKTIGVHEITTSLDGPEAIHDEVRQSRGNFRKVTETIAWLREAGITVDLVCVAHRLNAHVLSHTIDEGYRAGASSITISGFNVQAGAAASHAARLLLPADQEALVHDQIQTSRERYGTGFPVRTVGLLKRFTEPVPCPITDMVAINAEGLVSGCLLAPTPRNRMPHVRDGLARAFKAINRHYCCSQSGWVRPLAVGA